MTTVPSACPAADTVPAALAQLRAQLAGCAGVSETARCAQLTRALGAFAAAMPLADLRALLPAPSASSYQRRVLAADPQGQYCAAAIVWGAGQFSPVHAHHTWCAYVVLDGTLTETLYDWCREHNAARPASRRSCAQDTISYTNAGYSGIHCLGNSTAAPAISLHIYGVAEQGIATGVNHLLPALTV
jgi:predicted metal-dependent enzyme (double-stranded beta helix superfamily)